MIPIMAANASPLTHSRPAVLLLLAVALTLQACTCMSKGQVEFDVGMSQRGAASWYGTYFHGLATASGETYDMYAMTAAHRTLPLGTVVSVTNVRNGKRVIVRINDRGPYKKGRVLDLSFGAARKLGMVERGVSPVHITIVADQAPSSTISAFFKRASDESLPGAAALPSMADLAVPMLPSSGGLSRRQHRLPPADLLRAPRSRRVGDILDADHQVYLSIAALRID